MENNRDLDVSFEKDFFDFVGKYVNVADNLNRLNFLIFAGISGFVVMREHMTEEDAAEIIETLDADRNEKANAKINEIAERVINDLDSSN